MPEVTTLIGDCRERLKTLPGKSVHCVVTSPPYWALRDYGVEGQIGSEPTLNEFLIVMADVFMEVHRVLRDDGTLWLNLGDTYIDKQLQGVPWRTALMLQAHGWILRSDIIWNKPNPVPEPNRGRPTVAHEYIFLFSKSKKYFYDNDAIRDPREVETDWDTYNASLGSNQGADADREKRGYQKCSHNQVHPNGAQKRTVWKVGTKGFPGAHFATFPPELIDPCVKAGTSVAGCCPHCGAPWQRVSEMTEAYKARVGKGWHNHQDDIKVGQRGVPSAFRGGPARVTTGFEPTCACEHTQDETLPCTVLDPFGGSGTTGEVALNNGQNAILIELNPEYKKFIDERTAQKRLNLFTGG